MGMTAYDSLVLSATDHNLVSIEFLLLSVSGLSSCREQLSSRRGTVTESGLHAIRHFACYGCLMHAAP